MDVSINVDGDGVCNSNSQIPFLDHMLDVSCSLELLKLSSYNNHSIEQCFRIFKVFSLPKDLP